MNRISMVFMLLTMGQTFLADLWLQLPTRLRTQQTDDRRATTETLIGEVINLNERDQTVTIKADLGQIIIVKMGVRTTCLRIPGGQPNVATALPFRCIDVGVGDRLMARGAISEDRKQFQAERVIVLSRTDIEKKRQHDLAEWKLRGIVGVVKELRPSVGEIELEAHRPNGVSHIIVTTKECAIRRYVPESPTFADAKPSALSEIKVGDHLRALGDQMANGTRFRAEQIVYGSFQTIGCVVVQVDLQKNEIAAKTLESKQSIVISIGKGSALHRIPGQMASLIARTLLASRPGNTDARPPGGPNAQKRAQGATDQKPMQSGAEPPAARVEGAVPPADLQRMIDDLPSLQLSDIKPGDVLAVAAATEANPANVTAIKLYAGVDAILTALNDRVGKRKTIALSAGLPLGVFDFNLGPLD